MGWVDVALPADIDLSFVGRKPLLKSKKYIVFRFTCLKFLLRR